MSRATPGIAKDGPDRRGKGGWRSDGRGPVPFVVEKAIQLVPLPCHKTLDLGPTRKSAGCPRQIPQIRPAPNGAGYCNMVVSMKRYRPSRKILILYSQH
jgi:hypothetical protein